MIRSAFLAIIGPPNAGKSTLINSLLNTKLNIVSSKPQTTRNSIAGVLTDLERGIQLVLTDTPGMLKKQKSLLDQKLHETILHAVAGADLILFLLSPEEEFTQYAEIIEKLSQGNKKVFLLLNKSDQQKREYSPEEIALGLPLLKISAKQKGNLQELFALLDPFITEPVQYYPTDFLSDRTERFFVKEYIRETLLLLLQDEIPHKLFVDIEEMEDRKNIYHIEAVIYADRENYKKMILGKNGAMIKQIGIQSRKRIEELLGKKVYLEIQVKIFPKWQNDPTFLKKLEYY